MTVQVLMMMMIDTHVPNHTDLVHAHAPILNDRLSALNDLVLELGFGGFVSVGVGVGVGGGIRVNVGIGSRVESTVSVSVGVRVRIRISTTRT